MAKYRLRETKGRKWKKWRGKHKYAVGAFFLIIIQVFAHSTIRKTSQYAEDKVFFFIHFICQRVSKVLRFFFDSPPSCATFQYYPLGNKFCYNKNKEEEEIIK